ncbi:MAG TPA: MerR family transcriptional regulator [Actinomycetota bacterium]|nr:MerR family transcriptional regulator [Actinomycetota bacterium]
MLTTDTGFRGPQVCKIVGITYRQLDYWARTGLVTPSVQSAQGSGSQRLYSFEDLVDLKLIKNLLDSGVSLQRVREAIDYLHEIGYELTGVTIASDGESVYACTSPQEVFDLLKKGQGVFGIAIDPVMREIEGSVSQLNTQAAEREQEVPTTATPVMNIRRAQGED